MNAMYEQNDNQNMQPGIVPYAAPVPGMAGGYDSLSQILWRGRWLLLFSMIVAAAAAYFYLRIATPMYESTSRILVEKPGERPNPAIPWQPVGSTSTNYLWTQADMIRSQEILAAALSDPNVFGLPTFANVDNPGGYLARTLSAKVGKNTDIIIVSARSAYPEDAARIVNAVVRAYIRWHEANRQLSTADLLKDLNKQLEDRSGELRLKRKERMMFERRYPEVVEGARGGIVSEALERLKQELIRARLNTIQQDSYYSGLQRFEKEPEKLRQYIRAHQASGAAPMDDGERTRLKEELLKTQLQLEEISADKVVQRSEITLLQNRRTELEKRIAELDGAFIQNHISLAKTLLEEARAREKQFTDMYEKEFAKVQNFSGQDSEYAFITSECEVIENLCGSLLKQVNSLDLNTRFEGLNIHVLERAVPATNPSSPKAPMTMGIGLMLGLMAGVGLALVRDWRDQRVRSADEITAILGVPVLGTVPSMSRGFRARAQKMRFAPSSRESEACRAIRTALFCSTPREQAMTMLVTSPSPLEGRTTLVSNLGIAMAQAGQRTLIVDADLRKPMQDRVFAMNRCGQGLTDVLAGTIAFEQAIRPSDIQGLDVLASGQSVPNPSEVLDSRAFGSVLAQLKGKYDRILIDSPPLDVVTDAQILAALCDVTLLVLRADKSTRMFTKRARDALLTVGARVAGVVVNDVSKRDGRYSYSSGYAYRYGYYGYNGRRADHRELPVGVVPPGANGTLGDCPNMPVKRGSDDAQQNPGRLSGLRPTNNSSIEHRRAAP